MKPISPLATIAGGIAAILGFIFVFVVVPTLAHERPPASDPGLYDSARF